jgi:predicted RNA binding protein YcfA (HicA-like mRNA interferase family)
MMAKLPRIDGRQPVAVLGRAGFDVIRVRGSHHLLRHPDGRTTTVPVHGRETIGPGLLSKILADCALSRDEFQRLL